MVKTHAQEIQGTTVEGFRNYWARKLLIEFQLFSVECSVHGEALITSSLILNPRGILKVQ